MGDIRDRFGPAHHHSNDTHEAAIVTSAVDPNKIPQAMKDELAELCIVRAQCRECDDSSLYVSIPGHHSVEFECKNDACSAKLYIRR